MLLLLLAIALLFGTPIQDPVPTTYFLKSHETLAGHVVALDGESAVIDVTFFGGSARIRRRLVEFAPASEFEIRMVVAPPTTFADHLKMAKTAVRLGIMGQAGEQAGIARNLSADDATGAQRQELDSWAAATLRALFDRAIEQRELADARHFLRLMVTRVPLQFSEDQIGGLFDVLADAEARSRTVTRTTAVAKETMAKRAEFDALLAPVLQHLQRADDKVREGLRNARRTVQATRSYEQALRFYKSASVQLQALLKRYDDDPEVQEEGAQLVQRVKDGAVQATVHAGNALTVQGDFRAALQWANDGLVLDPANEDAKALIRTIQIAQAAGNGWGGWNR